MYYLIVPTTARVKFANTIISALKICFKDIFCTHFSPIKPHIIPTIKDVLAPLTRKDFFLSHRHFARQRKFVLSSFFLSFGLCARFYELSRGFLPHSPIFTRLFIAFLARHTRATQSQPHFSPAWRLRFGYNPPRPFKLKESRIFATTQSRKANPAAPANHATALLALRCIRER